MLQGLSFGTWLKQRRRAFDLTQADLAGYVGCTVDTIYRIESGARRPSKQVATRLATILQIEDDDREMFLRLARMPLHGVEDDEYLVDMPYVSPLAPRCHLPVPATPLIERSEDVAHIREQLRHPNVRLMTIVGLAGVGKTRLSLQIASESLDMFADGAYFVPLAASTDAQSVERAIAHVLGVCEQGSEAIAHSLYAFLRDLDVLLVLDNFEQVVDGAGVVADLLEACPPLTILVTSRERLRLWSEWVWDLEGLSYPTTDAKADITSFGAVQLFVQRAQQVQHRWRLDAQNMEAVARICRLVGGLPLAVELAASAVRELDAHAIAHAIETTVHALVVNARDLPERHRSIWAALEHSWRLLGVDEQRVLPLLAVFRGGWTVEEAEYIADATPQVMQSLVERSLVRCYTAGDGTHRYSFHPMIQQYAMEKNADRRRFEEAARRHLDYFATMAERSEAALVGPDQKRWGMLLETEHDNLRAALRWGLDGGTPTVALAMAASLTQFWYSRGHWQEGREWLATIAASCDLAAPSPSNARALSSMATLAGCQNDYAEAVRLYERCIAMFEQCGDTLRLGRALQGLAEVVCNQRDYDRAIDLYERSLVVVRPHNNHLEIGNVLAHIGGIWLMRDELDTAAPLFDESLVHFRCAGDKGSIASSLTFAAAVALRRRNYVEARSLCEEAIGLCRELDHTIGLSWALRILGTVALEQGNIETAEQVFRESLSLRWHLRDKQGVAWVLEGFAQIASARGLPLRAARMWGKAAALRAEVGAPTSLHEREELEACIASTRRTVETGEWTAAWRLGQVMQNEDAVMYALTSER